MKKKYKLTDETINVCGKKLCRIEALKDFGDVKKGDKGGFIEDEHNLSHAGIHGFTATQGFAVTQK